MAEIGLSATQVVKTRVKKGPLAAPRACAVCADLFAPHKKNPDAKFCSLSCQWQGCGAERWTKTMAHDSAKKRGDTQRGRGVGKSYRKLNGRHEHRVIAEQQLGRPLERGEIVHHDDLHKQNNIPGNLMVLPSQADHARLHFTGVKQSDEHVRKRVESRLRTLALRRAK